MEPNNTLPAHTKSDIADGVRITFNQPVTKQSYTTRQLLEAYNGVEFNWVSPTTVDIFSTVEDESWYE